ncbi:BAP1, transcription factor bZIP [Xylogone sp. PMI_703]|nr:BAP1, transcription factor bZIP [Xylogone sp. PMI_703]
MESRTISRTPLNPHFTLSPDQEKLLLAALYSNTAVPAIYNSNSNSNNSSNSNNNNKNNNKSTTSSKSNSNRNPATSSIDTSMAPSSLESPTEPAMEPTPTSATLNGFEESPFIDYDYEFDADGLDFDFTNDGLQGQMIGNLPGTSSDGDQEGSTEKRSHPGDEDDAGGGKRRESEEKASKKPGRKPLTSEPTSKRKAQNRAAQRAFRERKEKHLRDLETKVDDLQKASESANHENSILRAQIEKLTGELREYKKRLSLASAAARPLGSASYPNYMAGRGSAASSINDVNFQFEFPRFGRLPTPQSFKTLQGITPVSPSNGAQLSKTTSNDRDSASPKNATANSPSNNNTNGNKTNGTNKTTAGLNQTISQGVTDMSTFTGLFSPSLLESVSKSQSPFDFLGNKDSYTSRSSMDSTSGSGGQASTSHSSPSASSNSVHGPSSSCGTSPEPVAQSPSYSKPLDNTLGTIGEEHGKCSSGSSPGEISFCQKLNEACGNPHNPIPRTLSASLSASTSSNANNHHTDNLSTPNYDFNGIDFLAAQNGNQFDPQLYGDYREPQDNVLASGGFGDSFFSEAYPFNGTDFTSPYNTVSSPKKDLVSQIDQAQSADDVEVVPGEDTSKMLTCNTIWYAASILSLLICGDRLQACPKLKEGEFDLDGLCKDLQKKAKCSETGAVVNESDFHQVLENYVGHKVDSKAMEDMVRNG